MKRRIRDLVEDRFGEAGVVLLETALVMPMVVFLLCGGMEFCRYLWFQNVVADAAAEGARLAIMHEPSDAEVAAAVQQVLADQGVTTDHSVTIGQRLSLQPVSVTVEAGVDFVVLPSFLTAAANMGRVAATAVMTHMP
jgi:Flp pilus assembly protein TadG